MPTFDEITDSEIEPERPITTSLMTRLRDNLIAVAMRDGAVNRVKPPDVTVLSGSGNFTVPANVYRVRVIAVGAGNGTNGDTGSGGVGGNTTFGTITAPGGSSSSGKFRSMNGGINAATGFQAAGGEVVIGVIDTTPGATIAYSVGSGGAAGTGTGGVVGGPGTIIVEG